MIKKKNTRLLILAFFSLITLSGYSQDLIILRNGEQIDCKIIKVDSATIHYELTKGERKVSSYVAKNNLHSYKINATGKIPDNLNDEPEIPVKTVIIDTTRFVKESFKWTNLITYSKLYGENTQGWSVQYYGYNLRNTSRWAVPILFSIEKFIFLLHYLYGSKYQSVNMRYFSAGINPFYRLDTDFLLNLGANILYGEEELTLFYEGKNLNKFSGLSSSQGFYYISKSKIGIMIGLSVYEKLLSSEVYRNDLGLKIELGIKF